MNDIIEVYKRSNIQYCDGNHFGYCYVFYNPITKLCKIGWTKNNPLIRLSQLQSQNGVQLVKLIHIELCAITDCTAQYLELFLHRYFKDKRKYGEWFDLTTRDFIQIFWLYYHIFGDDLEYIDKAEFKSIYQSSYTPAPIEPS